VPVGDGYTYGFGNVTGARFHGSFAGRLIRLRQRFAAFEGPVQEFLAALICDEQIHVSPIEWLEREVWQSGRVVLIGDTAHASLPMMGQGGCLAMEDAWVLAEVEQVVLTTLAKDPKHRFGSIQAFAIALEQASQLTK
jgi:2-polyprenyl-6-methoxyphenol hydroxylase-like FAD-dependent oxidoreductase